MASYEIGKQVYIGEDLIIIDELDDKKRAKIGNRVTIAERVTLILNRQIRNFAAIIAKKSSKGHQAVEFFMSNMTLYERLSSVALLNKVNMGNIGLFGLR
jgi:UDP-3-O-[3-hydroxymyristoyl] glucosamine N-acyltransferase